MSQMKLTNDCEGKESLWGKDVTGGHVEDYIVDPNHKPNYPKKMEWVSVSQSFKKEGMSL